MLDVNNFTIDYYKKIYKLANRNTNTPNGKGLYMQRISIDGKNYEHLFPLIQPLYEGYVLSVNRESLAHAIKCGRVLRLPSP